MAHGQQDDAEAEGDARADGAGGAVEALAPGDAAHQPAVVARDGEDQGKVAQRTRHHDPAVHAPRERRVEVAAPPGGGERDQADWEHEDQVGHHRQPVEVAQPPRGRQVRHPEHPDDHEAHHQGEEMPGHALHRVVIARQAGESRRPQIEDHQGHDNGEDRVGEEDHPVEQALIDRLVLGDVVVAAVAHAAPGTSAGMMPCAPEFRKGALPSGPGAVIQLFDDR